MKKKLKKKLDEKSFEAGHGVEPRGRCHSCTMIHCKNSEASRSPLTLSFPTPSSSLQRLEMLISSIRKAHCRKASLLYLTPKTDNLTRRSLRYRWHERNQGSTDVKIHEWSPLRLCPSGHIRCRQQEFSIRIAATTTRCLEDHRWVVRAGEGATWRFEARNCFLDTPFPDAIVVEFAISVTRRGTTLSFKCFANVHFQRRILFLTNQILDGTLDQYRRSFANMERLLEQRLLKHLPGGSASDLASLLHTEGVAVVRLRLNDPSAQPNPSSPVYLSVSGPRARQVEVVAAGSPCRPSTCDWRLAVVHKRGTSCEVSLQNVFSAKYMGHDAGGRIVAAAESCRRWELWELEHRSGTIALRNIDWFWGAGAYLCKDKGVIRCSTHGDCSALEFILEGGEGATRRRTAPCGQGGGGGGGGEKGTLCHETPHRLLDWTLKAWSALSPVLWLLIGPIMAFRCIRWFW